MNSVRLTTNDAYALRRRLARMPADDIQTSATMRLLLDIYDADSEIGLKRLLDVLQQHPDVMKQVLESDPSAPLEITSNIVHVNDLHLIKRPDYSIDDYPFYDSEFNAVVGPSGGGKTYIVIDAASRIALKKTGTVLYLSAEGVPSFSERWAAWRTYHERQGNTVPHDIPFHVYRVPVNFLREKDVDLFISEIEPMDPSYVIIDTLARCFIGGDENSAQDMGMFISNVDKVRRYFNCGIIIVHHTGNNGKIRGSSALYAACDSVLALYRNEDEIVLSNSYDKGGKNKHRKELPQKRYRFLTVEFELDGEAVESAVVIPSVKFTNQTPPDETEEINLTSNQKQILEFLAPFADGTNSKELQSATNINPSTIYYNLNALAGRGLIDKSGNNYAITPKGVEALEGKQ